MIESVRGSTFGKMLGGHQKWSGVHERDRVSKYGENGRGLSKVVGL